jgi:non-lysosomal glucosylceramidase
MPDHPPISRREFVATIGAAAAFSAIGGGAAAMPTSSSSSPRTRNAALKRKLSVDVPESDLWPVLTRYDEEHLRRVAMPIGGIGTGTISLGGRGDLRDWELVNRPAKGYAPQNSFFALYCENAGKTIARCIEGPIDPMLFEGSSGSPIRNHGLPRFRRCNFAAAYPLGQVLVSDDDVPLRVRIEAFNPFIPSDTDASGIPVVALRFVLINPTSSPINASVCGSVENFIGWDGGGGKAIKGFNEYREKTGWRVRGVYMQSAGVPKDNYAWGTLALSTTASQGVTHRTSWADVGWGDALLDFWDDFSADGRLDERESKRDAPMASLAAPVVVPANAQSSVMFLITWHFPNRQAWNPPNERIGNHYCTKYADAWDAAVKAAELLPDLEKKTVQFVRAFCDSDVPAPIKEAALFNASTLRTQTAFRAEDGNFFGWEGCNDHAGCCHGSCTHVWNYEQATAFLFSSMARSMRDVEFGHATRDNGYMSFRVNLPLLHATEAKPAAADGQMGTVMKLYRDWRMSGDDEMLKRLWPHAKKALQFAWIDGGWDGDRDGVMEGCQHNTMDIEYYGPNPEVGTWYLGALRAAEEMAKHVGDDGFARNCHDLFERGSKGYETTCFNGEYYEQKVVPPGDAKLIATDLRLGAGATNLADPEYQLGAGCLTDQLVGQYMAHVCGLGYLLDRDHVRATLASVMKYNWRDDFLGHFNQLRSYALDDDQGLIVATYPRGNRPKRPFPYCNEVWTGLEYTAAAGMLFEGMIDDAVKVIAAARDRHDGFKRNPFDEAECGHHYARAMASWGCYIAATGFAYDGATKTMRMAASTKPATWFWSNGDAWGTVKQDAGRVTVNVMRGTISLARVRVGEKTVSMDAPRDLKEGESVEVRVTE